MQKLKLILVATAFLLSGCGGGGDDDSEPYYEVGVAFNRMHRDPNQACEYVSNHASTFDSRFESCGIWHVERLQAEIDRLKAECNEIFIDPYDLLKCDEDRGVPTLELKKSYLSAVLEITNKTGGCVNFGCNCTNFENYFQATVDFFNSTAPPNMTWQQIMDESLEGHKQEYVCH